MKISKWLIDARSNAELTQTQLGEKLSVTKGNVSAWENDRHEPGWSQMLKISEITEYPLPLPKNLMPTSVGNWPFRSKRSDVEKLGAEELEQVNSYIEFVVAKWQQQNKSKKTA